MTIYQLLNENPGKKLSSKAAFDRISKFYDYFYSKKLENVSTEPETYEVSQEDFEKYSSDLRDNTFKDYFDILISIGDRVDTLESGASFSESEKEILSKIQDFAEEKGGTLSTKFPTRDVFEKDYKLNPGSGRYSANFREHVPPDVTYPDGPSEGAPYPDGSPPGAPPPIPNTPEVDPEQFELEEDPLDKRDPGSRIASYIDKWQDTYFRTTGNYYGSYTLGSETGTPEVSDDSTPALSGKTATDISTLLADYLSDSPSTDDSGDIINQVSMSLRKMLGFDQSTEAQEHGITSDNLSTILSTTKPPTSQLGYVGQTQLTGPSGVQIGNQTDRKIGGLL